MLLFVFFALVIWGATTLRDGVNISGLRKVVVDILPLVEMIFRQNGAKHWAITSGNDGLHMPGSLHYANLAVDLRTWELTDAQKAAILRDFKAHTDLRDFDLIFEKDHAHLEYDPKSAS